MESPQPSHQLERDHRDTNKQGFAGRPTIQSYKGGRKFWVGDRVFVREPGVLRGPLIVASIDPNDHTYTLNDETGTSSWENGRKVKEEDLQQDKEMK